MEVNSCNTCCSVEKLLFDWHCGSSCPSYCCDPGSIPGVACEMVMWSPSQAGGFPPGTPVSFHTNTTRT